ncbi:MAG: hypothetical protein H7263_08075 [Candidatus Sericytochromatia bacterium]|nr:hypothetical protein [Candidatus Sericytochromatia bacterium]
MSLISCTENTHVIFESPYSSPSTIPSILLTANPITTSSPTFNSSINNSLSTPTNVIVAKTSLPISTPIPTPLSTPFVTPTPLISSNNILFDTSKNPFGNSSDKSITNLSKLTDFLTSSGFNITSDDFNNVNLDNISTIIIFCPSKDYSFLEINKLIAFVKSGKKVVITGEWGGFGSFTDTSINIFLKQANLKINQDVIKETLVQNYNLDNEHLLIKKFNTHPITKNINLLSFYSSASISVISGGIIPIDYINTQLIAFSGDQSFTIQDNIKHGVVAVSNIGNGKVVVIGDSSEFTDKDTDKSGKVNLDEASNKEFILNILNW